MDDKELRYFLWRSKVDDRFMARYVYISTMQHKSFLSKVEVIVEDLTQEDALALKALMNAGVGNVNTGD